MTTPPPLTLHDEQARLALAGAAEALASTAGSVYPIVYAGPLQDVGILRSAAEEAGQAFGVDLVEWRPPAAVLRLIPTLLLCPWGDLEDALVAAEGHPALQVIAWGGEPFSEIPQSVRERIVEAGGIAVDPTRQPGADSEGSWLGGHVERLLRDGRPHANPLVVVGPEAALSLHADEVRLHLDCAGVVAIEVRPSLADSVRPHPGIALLSVVTGSDSGSAAPVLAAAIAECRIRGVPFVIIAAPAGWEALRTHPAWRMVGGCTVVGVGDVVPDPALSGVSWPPVPAVWVGGPRSTAAVEAVLALPPGTTVLGALVHLDVWGRAGRVVVWETDRVAIIDLAPRPAGAVVTGVQLVGSPPCGTREEVLETMDRVRGWAGARMALVALEDAVPSAPAIEETVSRVGFHLSRRDDERDAGGEAAFTVPPASTLRVHEVAEVLFALGLPLPAGDLLQGVERDSAFGAREEALLGFLMAEREPDEAITRLRHAAMRLAAAPCGSEERWAEQTDATLNALLLMVRRRQVTAQDAWAPVSRWIRTSGTVWVRSARHAAGLFELAARAGRVEEARRFATLFRDVAAPDDPLHPALAPAIRIVFQDTAA